MANVNFDRAAMAFTFESAAGPVGDHLREVGRKIVTAARAQVGKDTNQLASSISYSVTNVRGMAHLEVSASAPHALLHHEGSLPHLITPNKVRVVRFNNNGKTVFAKQVMHPGTKPNRFLSDNLILVRS